MIFEAFLRNAGRTGSLNELNLQKHLQSSFFEPNGI